MNARNVLLLLLAPPFLATAACVRVPGEVEATFAPYEPGEPSHFHPGARPAAAPPAVPAPAAAAAPAVDAGSAAPIAPATVPAPATAGGAV